MLDARPRGPRRSTGWCCSTCPTTTPPRSPTTSRSTGWSSWPTCWSGCSTRRSTPTPRSTTATSRRWPAHRDVMLVVLNHIDEVAARPAAPAMVARPPAAARRTTGSTASRCSPPRRAHGEGIAELRSAIAERVAAKKAVNRPGSTADVADAAAAAGRGQRRRRRPRDAGPQAAVASSSTRFADAAGVPDRRRRGRARRPGCGPRQATGWPLTAWLRGSGPTRSAAAPRPRRGRQGADRGRRARRCPRPTQVQRARVDTAVRAVADEVGRRADPAVGGRRPPGVGLPAARPRTTASTGPSPPPTSASPAPRSGAGGPGAPVAADRSRRSSAACGWRSRGAGLPPGLRARPPRRAGCRCRRCCCSAGWPPGVLLGLLCRALVGLLAPGRGRGRPSGGCGRRSARSPSGWSSSRSRPSSRPTAATRAGLAAALR